MEDNKVKVRIYGQEYTISGERDEETIIEIADYVDGKMREISRFFSSNIPKNALPCSLPQIFFPSNPCREHCTTSNCKIFGHLNSPLTLSFPLCLA